MKIIMTRVKYIFQVFQKEHFWLPVSIMALFVIIIGLIPEANQYNAARGFLGFTLPLITGGLSAYAFLADSALELQFTTKHRIWQMISERLGIIMVIIGLTSLVFQAIIARMGISLSPLGGIMQRQLVWFVPCFVLLTLGGAVSLMAKNSNSGFSLVGGIWILQLLTRGWFARKPILRNLLLFYGSMDPLSTQRVYNQVTLMTISFLLLIATYALLKKQERYI